MHFWPIYRVARSSCPLHSTSPRSQIVKVVKIVARWTFFRFRDARRELEIRFWNSRLERMSPIASGQSLVDNGFRVDEIMTVQNLWRTNKLERLSATPRRCLRYRTERKGTRHLTFGAESIKWPRKPEAFPLVFADFAVAEADACLRSLPETASLDCFVAAQFLIAGSRRRLGGVKRVTVTANTWGVQKRQKVDTWIPVVIVVAVVVFLVPVLLTLGRDEVLAEDEKCQPKSELKNHVAIWKVKNGVILIPWDRMTF